MRVIPPELPSAPAAKGDMAEVSKRRARIESAFARLSYRVRNLVSLSRPIHVVVSGPDDRGAELLARHLATSHLTGNVAYVAGSALSVPKLRSRVIVSFDPEDVMRVDHIVADLGGMRHLIFLFVTADPRGLVSERCEVLPHHFSQGADYRLRVGPGPIRSLTGPGVLPRLAAAKNAIRTPGVTGLIVSRGDLLDRIGEVQESLSALFAERGLKVAPDWTSPLDDHDGVKDLRADWTASATRRTRVAQQVQRFPGIEDEALKLGYAPVPLLPEGTRADESGTIIAFHTPDEVYRTEAARLKKSLDALGLSYRIFEVEPEKNWVRTTLLKPSWIYPIRQEMRGPLLYVDVDAYFHLDPWPLLAALEGDLGALVYPNGELNSATIWLNDTPEALTLLAQWRDAADDRREKDGGDLRQRPSDSDQAVLQRIVEEDEASVTPRFRFVRLVPNLGTIHDQQVDSLVGPIVIEQLQVSREARAPGKRLARRRERLAQLGQ